MIRSVAPFGYDVLGIRCSFVPNDLPLAEGAAAVAPVEEPDISVEPEAGWIPKCVTPLLGHVCIHRFLTLSREHKGVRGDDSYLLITLGLRTIPRPLSSRNSYRGTGNEGVNSPVSNAPLKIEAKAWVDPWKRVERPLRATEQELTDNVAITQK